ncbi:uncharacterized protein LOC111133990 [Crassostrea virginica]
MENHHGHTFDDLEDIYAEKYTLQQGEFTKIQKYFLPTSQDLKTDIEEDVTQIRKIMESIRTSMKAETESLKNLADEVTSENIEHTHRMEKSLLEMLKSQETTYDDYITYLEKITDEFQESLSSTNRNLLFSAILKIQAIPETTKPVPPEFTAGEFTKQDVAKLLGRVNVPNTKPKRRKIQPMEAVPIHIKSTEKQLEQSKEKSDVKLTSSEENPYPMVEVKLTKSQSLTFLKVREYSVPGVNNALHVSVDTSDRLWVSDFEGNLVQIDLQGKQLQKIQTSGGWESNHTATQDGDLIYTDKDERAICRITPDRKITEFIKTGDWTPVSVHSSRINGDILVLMMKDGEAKVTRHSKTGRKKKSIHKYTRHTGNRHPCNITENINGDIVVSDFSEQKVMFVNKLGKTLCFGRYDCANTFLPTGICTEAHGHILVWESWMETMHLFDQDWEFLGSTDFAYFGFMRINSLCVDVENNLYMGRNTNKVTVYKCIQDYKQNDSVQVSTVSPTQ